MLLAEAEATPASIGDTHPKDGEKEHCLREPRAVMCIEHTYENADHYERHDYHRIHVGRAGTHTCNNIKIAMAS
jgi:hypothetical protein